MIMTDLNLKVKAENVCFDDCTAKIELSFGSEETKFVCEQLGREDLLEDLNLKYFPVKVYIEENRSEHQPFDLEEFKTFLKHFPGGESGYVWFNLLRFDETFRSFIFRKVVDQVILAKNLQMSEETEKKSSMKNIRPSWDEYFRGIMHMTAARASCDRGKSGCVIVRDHRLISAGYVGAPSGMPSCDEVGHQLEDGHCVRTIHAEQNAICSAAKYGIALEGAELYCTMTPCRVCSRLIAQCGIKAVHCDKKYPHPEAVKETHDLFKQLGITIDYESDEEVKYE